MNAPFVLLTWIDSEGRRVPIAIPPSHVGAIYSLPTDNVDPGGDHEGMLSRGVASIVVAGGAKYTVAEPMDEILLMLADREDTAQRALVDVMRRAMREELGP